MDEEEYESKINCDHFLAEVKTVKGKNFCGRCDSEMSDQQVEIMSLKTQLYVQLEGKKVPSKKKNSMYG